MSFCKYLTMATNCVDLLIAFIKLSRLLGSFMNVVRLFTDSVALLPLVICDVSGLYSLTFVTGLRLSEPSLLPSFHSTRTAF